MAYDSYLFGTLAIFGFIILSVVGALLVRHISNIQSLTRHHEVMGYFFPVVASIYGILLGLIVVNSIELFDRARDTVNQESNMLIAVYMLADSLPEETRNHIKGNCKAYAQAVIDLEWETMDVGVAHPVARSYALSLFEDALKASKNGSLASAKLLDGVEDLWLERRDRMDQSTRTIPGIEWFALCAGGLLVTLFSYMFVLDSLLVQIAATTVTSLMISLNLFLVVLFGHPHSGDLRVSSQPFAHALDVFDAFEHRREGEPLVIAPR